MATTITTTQEEEATTDDLRCYLYGAVQALCSAVDTAERWEHCAPDRDTQRVVATCLAATAPGTCATVDDCLYRINSATHAYLRVLRHIRPRHYAHLTPAARDFVPWRPLAEMHALHSPPAARPQHDNEKVLGLLTCALQGLAAALRDALRLGGHVGAAAQTLVRLVCAAQRAHVSGLRAWNMCVDCGAATLAALGCVRAQRCAAFGAPDAAAHVHWLPRAQSAPDARQGGPAVLVCGTSLAALKDVLDAAQGTAVRVFTHGALLAAHLHPRLRQYRALAGHYGSSSSDDAVAAELAAFPGPVLLTGGAGTWHRSGRRVVRTGKVFTCAPVGGRAAHPVINGNYGPLLRAAAAFPGFLPASEHASSAHTARTLTVRDAPGVVATRGAEVAAALRARTLRHVYVVCGMGTAAAPVRALVARLPPDCMVLVFSAGDDEEEDNDEKNAEVGNASDRAATDSASLGRARWGMVPGTALPRVVAMGRSAAALGDVVLGVRAMQQHVVRVGTLEALPLTLLLMRGVGADTVAPLLALAHAGVRSTYYAATTLPALARPAGTLARFLCNACGLAPLNTVPALLADTLPPPAPLLIPPTAPHKVTSSTTSSSEDVAARIASAVES